MKIKTIERTVHIWDGHWKDIPDLTGKIMIVTGANSGLGFETTRELANKGAKVIMACRNEKKAEAAKRKIKQVVPHADLEIMKLDVSSQKSVEEFAKMFEEKYDRLDALVNNAGIMAAPYKISEDGFENHFATNYLGHFALTGRLLNKLEDTPGSRVVSVSSIAYFFGNKIDFDTISYVDKKRYQKWHAYGRSKMECLLYAYEMDRRLKAANMRTKSVAAHPGLARTNIMQAQAKNELSRIARTALSYTLKPTIYGAMPLIRAAVDENIKGGEYFGPSKGKLPDVVESNKASHSLDVAQRLWDLSEVLSGVSYLD